MNWKTTIAGAAAALLPWAKTTFPKWSGVIDGLTSAALLGLGYYAADKGVPPKTG